MSARYNRIFGDSQTDTLFTISLYAVQGQPSSFSPPTSLAYTETEFFSDGDPDTWELLSLELPLPIDTDYISIQIRTIENVFDDPSGIEFDGYYADAVSITIVPEPSTLLLLALNAVMVRRKHC